MIELYTVQMGQWRKVQALGIELLDITVKTGVKEFAPDWQFLMDYKRGIITDADYTRLYTARMRESYLRHPEVWQTLKMRPRVAFACYCKAGEFCHRLLFVEMVKSVLQNWKIECTYQGEIT